MSDGTGLAEALLGLDGFRVLQVTESPDELVIRIETDVDLVGCSRCGVRTEAQDRMAVDIRDLACFGRPARLVWIKRRWRCTPTARPRPGPSSPWMCTPSRAHPPGRGRGLSPDGAEARPVARVAAELGVCWATVMSAVGLPWLRLAKSDRRRQRMR